MTDKKEDLHWSTLSEEMDRFSEWEDNLTKKTVLNLREKEFQMHKDGLVVMEVPGCKKLVFDLEQMQTLTHWLLPRYNLSEAEERWCIAIDGSEFAYLIPVSKRERFRRLVKGCDDLMKDGEMQGMLEVEFKDYRITGDEDNITFTNPVKEEE